MNAGHPGRNGNRRRNLCIGNGPHADHHRAAESPCRLAGDICVVHRHIDALLDLPDGNVRLQQRSLKGKAAPDQEADKILPFFKIAHNIGRFLCQHTVFVDAVARNIAGDIAARRKPGKAALPGISHLQQRAGLGVALAEQKEIPCQRLRQYNKVALRIAVAIAGCGAGQFARADQCPHRSRRSGRILHTKSPFFSPAAQQPPAEALPDGAQPARPAAALQR